MTKIFAHRGCPREAPENTLPAFAAAIAAGADGVEFDVQLSRDGEPVVIHDETLERTTDGRGWVKDHSADDLAGLTAAARHRGFAGVGVPRLTDVLALLAPSGLQVNIELKNSVVDYPGLEQVVLEAVAAAGLEERVVLSSFSVDSVRRLVGLTDLEVAWVYSRPPLRPIAAAAELGVRAIHPSRRAISRWLVGRAHRRGLAVRPWIVNNPQWLRWMFNLGVDALFTDLPERALSLRAEVSGE